MDFFFTTTTLPKKIELLEIIQEFSSKFIVPMTLEA